MTLEMMADGWWRIESLSWMFYVERETTNEPGSSSLSSEILNRWLDKCSNVKKLSTH